jgi:glucose/arabinose dehydrogenase
VFLSRSSGRLWYEASSWGVRSAALLLLALAFGAGPALGSMPAGFKDAIAISGRTNPTSVSFAPDGRIFVTEKSGKIWLYQSLGDTSPALFADLSSKVVDYWDRGLLGLAIPPAFRNRQPRVCAVHVRRANQRDGADVERRMPHGSRTDHRWLPGQRAAVAAHRLRQCQHRRTGPDQRLVPAVSEPLDTLLFGRDGYLYAGGGDGANFNSEDWGQFGSTYSGDQSNPCGHPPRRGGERLWRLRPQREVRCEANRCAAPTARQRSMAR